MAYALGPVKPNVKAAVEYFAPKHGIGTVYGYRPIGSVPNSDHPKGLAVDFMTSNKARGDALAADLIANGGTYGLTYVIWWRRIWQGDWKPYDGPVSHTDHVHASFSASASPPTQNVANPLVPDAVENLIALLKRLDQGFAFMTSASGWKRIGLFVVGFALMLLAIVRWNNVKTAVKGVSKYAK